MTQGWPAWATAPVVVVPHDPAWSDRGAQLRSDMERLLAPWLDGAVEHVGSTAVPDLPAKPIIDLLAPVRSLAASAAADDVLREHGWELVPPELDGRPWRRLHVLPRGAERVAHLHLMEPRHPRWRETIAFRDALRDDAALAQRYADLKQRLSEQHAEDREAYTDAKSAFVADVLAGRSTQARQDGPRR